MTTISGSRSNNQINDPGTSASVCSTSPVTKGKFNTATWDMDKAIKTLNKNAQPKSTSNCATYVRIAIEAGGITITRSPSAKDYGINLVKAGFIKQCIDSSNLTSLKQGDVAVIQPYPGGNPNGHMAMFNGNIWVSDFKQTHKLYPYPGPTYMEKKPSFAIYRYPSGP